jgi:TP901 family phage tail tape measure protein
MAVVGELLVLLAGSNAGLSAALLKSEGELKGFSASATSHGNIASNALHGVGIAGAAVATGVAVYLGAASKSAIEFQGAMGQVGVTAHLSGDALDELGSAIEHASLGTTTSSLAMVQALIPVAGELQLVTGHALTAADAVNVLGAAESLHVATNTGLAESLKGITDLLLTYHLGTAAAGSVASLLFAAHAQLGLSVESLSGGLQRLQPRIVASGISIGEMLALVREMEPVVGTGAKAMLKLGAILQSFLLPSGAAKKVLDDLDVTLVNAQGKFIGLGPAVEALHDAMVNLTPAERAADLVALFGKNANIAAELIRQGAPGLAANLAALGAQGTAAGAAATLNENLGNKLEIARATIATMTDAIGGALLPALSGIADIILPIVTQIGAWATANPELASQILLVAGAVGALAYGLTNFGSGLGLLFGPMGLLLGVVGVLALAWKNNWLGMRDVVASVIGAVGPVISGISSVLSDFSNLIQTLFSEDASQVSQFTDRFAGAGAIIVPVVQAIQSAFATIGGVISTVVYALSTPTNSVRTMKDIFLGNIPPIIRTIQQFRDTVVSVIGFISTNVIPALGNAFNWIVTNVLPVVQAAFTFLVTVVLPALLRAFAAVAEWIRANWPLISTIVGQVAGAISTAFQVIFNIVRTVLGWFNVNVPAMGHVLAGVGVVATVLLTTISAVFTAIGVVWQTAANMANLAGEGIKTIWTAVGAAIQVAVNIGTTAINALIAVVDTVAKVIAAFFGWLFTNTGTAKTDLGGLAPGTPTGSPKVPGVTSGVVSGPAPAYHGAGSTSYTPTTTTVGGVPVSGMFQHGGIVPGFGAQLVIAHGGETIIPPGAGAAGGINSVRHIHIEVGGRELMEYIDREMFGSASGFSSGFTSNSPVTGA